jgi:soluble cytochrome b562
MSPWRVSSGPGSTEGTDPVNKKLTAALCGGTVLALALTGCGSDDSKKKTDEWAKKVCDQVKPQVKKIQDANSAIDKASAQDSAPQDVQKADSEAFQDLSDAYKSLATAVDKAGEPPADDGAKLSKNAVKALNDIATSYSGLKSKVDEMNTEDQAEFADGLKEIVEELDKLGKSSDNALNKLQSGDLGKAMSEQSGCQSPDTSSSPSSA